LLLTSLDHSSMLEWGVVLSSETSVNFYRNARCHIPVDSIPHIFRSPGFTLNWSDRLFLKSRFFSANSEFNTHGNFRHRHICHCCSTLLWCRTGKETSHISRLINQTLRAAYVIQCHSLLERLPW
jgi:hypothetical protein